MGGVKKKDLARRKNVEKARQARQARKRKVEEDVSEVTGAHPCNATRPTTQATPDRPSTSKDVTPSTSTAAGTSTSAKKRRKEVGEVPECVAVDEENIILRKSYLQSLMSQVCCSSCYGRVNVSFNHVHLDYKVCIKCAECGKNANRHLMDYAIGRAVLDYNAGYEDSYVLPQLALPYTKIQQSYLKKKDKEREAVRRGRKRKEETGVDPNYAAGDF